MDSFDIFDDIDFEYGEPEFSKENSVSQYCIAIFDATNHRPIGTGVLINSQGLFISVAHNFNNEKCEIKAFFEGRVYNILQLYKEYELGKFYLFIGQLVSFNSDAYSNSIFPILAGPVQLEIRMKLCIAGFKELIITGTENLGISNPIADLHLIKQRLNSQVLEPDAIQKSLLTELGDNFTFFLRSEGAEKYKGFSGGPVYSDGKIYGIVVYHYFLKSDYITSILKSIDFK